MRETGNDVTPNDPIEQYLTQLRTRLRVPRHEAELILTEAEDHLRETAATGLAAGMTEREARDAAISSFGSVQAVVRAHEVRQTGGAAIIDLGMAAWKLGSLGLLAAMLESSSDAVSLRVVAGMAGLMLLALYLVARRFQRRYRPGREVLTTRFFPPLAVACFAAIAMGLTLATVFGYRLGVAAGPGSYLSGAMAALALAVGLRGPDTANPRGGWLGSRARPRSG
jgi:hypothetical protein